MKKDFDSEKREYKIVSKYEHDLFNEADYKVEKIYRIKRFGNIDKNEKWKIFEDSNIIMVIEGEKLTNKEKEFLRKMDGINFLLNQAKLGIKNITALRADLKKKISEVLTNKK